MASELDTSVQHLSQLLTALTQPNTQVIRQAEASLKPLLKQAETMMSLWQIIATTTNNNTDTAALRHVAAIVLRKRLAAHYANWNNKLEWQQQVLQALAMEQERGVRSGLVGVAACMAAVEQGPTQPFLQFLAAASSDGQATSRELTFLLLQEMTETVGLHWKNHLNDLYQLFFAVLNNPKEEAFVQKAAVKAVGQLMSFWADDAEMDGLAPLLPILLQVASAHVGDDEDFLAVVLDVLYDLAFSPAAALQPHLTLTLQFSLQCLRNRNLELRVRDAAALVIATTAEAKPKTVGRSEALLGAILDCLFQLMQESPESAAGALFESNPAWRADLEDEMGGQNDDNDNDDPDAPTETSMAQGTLDMLACEIPKKYIWQAASTRCLERMACASDANARKAGVAGLGVIAEGCNEPLTLALPHVLPHVLNMARDESAQVRECACFCLGQISEHCQPDILQYSSQILPIVFGLLDDGSVAVQATSCYVLEMFCERLEPQAVRPLLDSLVRKLATMLEATTKRCVQEMAVAALAATAVAAEEEFTPYVPGVANLMTKLMQVQETHLYSLRGRALECMGHMAIAVGRDTFRPYFTVTMQCAMEGLTKDSTELQEFAYAVFANLAKVMKDEFAPALPDLVPHLVKVIDLDEGQLEQAGVGGGGENAAADLANLDDSDDEEDGGNYVLHVRTALVEVKKGAITALGEMAAHTGTAFCPFLQDCMQVLQKAATNWHPLIKAEVADAFPAMIVPSIDAYHNGELEWKKADLATPVLSAHTTALVGAVLQEEIALLRDEDKMTVGKACEAVQSVIELCGPQAFVPVANDCLTCLHLILTKTATCQTADAMYGELPDDDDDHDGVMQAACDLIGAICRVMGSAFAPYLPQFLPAILEYAKSSRPPSDRSMAVGCLSEIATEMDGQVTSEYWPTVFLPAVVAGLADAEDNVKRNAAFLGGVCCEHLGQAAANDYPTLLQGLGPILGASPDQVAAGGEAAAACMDNAAAAVARMILAVPNAVAPMNQVLPVFLNALPLKTDMTENETVYSCILGLMEHSHPDILTQGEALKRIFTQATADGSLVADEVKTKLRDALSKML